MNLYGFVENRIYTPDNLGLTDYFLLRNQSNCFGYAATGRLDVFLYPNQIPNSSTSFMDLLNSDGWKCQTVKSYEECKCSKCRTKMLITLYINDTGCKGNPFTNKNFPWNPRNTQIDIHAIRSNNAQANSYTQIPNAGTINRLPEKVSQATLNDIFSEPYPLMCCCKEDE